MHNLAALLKFLTFNLYSCIKRNGDFQILLLLLTSNAIVHFHFTEPSTCIVISTHVLLISTQGIVYTKLYLTATSDLLLLSSLKERRKEVTS